MFNDIPIKRTELREILIEFLQGLRKTYSITEKKAILQFAYHIGIINLQEITYLFDHYVKK